MNKIRFSFLAVAAALALTGGGLQAQTSIQRVNFALFTEYQTNSFNIDSADSETPLTNEYSRLRTVLVTTGNVVKALAVDLEGTNFSTWTGSDLVREVNLTNGNEGIFLRKNGTQTNVSSFFGDSFSNNFTAGLSNAFPGFTNNISGLTNYINGSTNNPYPQVELVHGLLRMTSPTNSTTNYITTAGLYFVSLNTTNLKFNLVAVGNGIITNVAGGIDGTLYERPINSEFLGSAGSFYLNIMTNLFDAEGNQPVYFTGPMRGTFNVGPPWFSTIAGP
jgi:hypothetical protein